jgi:hypothetical protein
VHFLQTWHDPLAIQGKDLVQILTAVVEAVVHVVKDALISTEKEKELTEATRKIIEEDKEKW